MLQPAAGSLNSPFWACAPLETIDSNLLQPHEGVQAGGNWKHCFVSTMVDSIRPSLLLKPIHEVRAALSQPGNEIVQ